MREGRSRFNHTDLHEKDEGAKALLSMLSKEIPIFYSNDQDHGITSASFIPFFGISAATIHVLPKLIQKYHLTLLLCIPQLTDTGYQIELTLDSEITRVSQTGDFDSALHLINIWYEKVIRQIPEQYLWMHRRFKTRPPGEPNVYTELLKSQIKRES
jgi:KDO2-lipid IV(A) lauroyltransferase